jgi:myo-inositol 2-dehydrogenase/D-chiro-inositol 1-dehydrogenase
MVLDAEVLRVGVIGGGGMGREHVVNLAARPDAEVVVVADVVAENAAAAAALADAEASVDPFAVARRSDVHAVVIASPDETHAGLAIAAIQSGHHVFCEKPVANTVEDARRVLEAEAVAGGSLVQVGFMRQYDPAHRQVFDALAGVGRLQHVRCVHRNTNDQWSRPLEVVLTQSLIHDVHTVRWLSGSEFRSVMTHVVSRRRPVDHLTVVGTLTDGTTATLEFVEAAYGYDVEIEVTAEDGMVICAQPGNPVVRQQQSAHRFVGDDWFGRFSEAYRLEMDDWVGGVFAGEVRGPSTSDGLAAQSVVAAAIRSAATGLPESV